ncbi:MAG TPA: bifunctional DNA-formamidopyrimidine glycosylase/DNA-(apurinic or apyrimidinic site) lyase [Candidatus Acidoferrum sp.]|nr:bifunctional DNA-formamidopyrimidine glycosylase/DNA-(apurinic or apyrimidinic site) lyase [Candidatus Acidoferrum sp.]
MPEAPEVEAVARSLRPLISGRTIRACKVIHRIAARPQSASLLERNLRGALVKRVMRRGKYLLLKLTRGVLVLHFRLDGQLIWFDGAPPRGIHVDVLLNFNRGALGFVDRRHFGRANWHQDAATVPSLRALGVDVFSRSFTHTAFHQLLGASRRPLKILLMDQSKIAGLGNIYSNEALWHARLHPRRRSNGLNAAESRLLYKAIVSTVKRALECCCSPAPNFRDPEWWFQGIERILKVYALEGKPCRRCETRIRRIQQGGRSTFFCPRCQR